MKIKLIRIINIDQRWCKELYRILPQFCKTYNMGKNTTDEKNNANKFNNKFIGNELSPCGEYILLVHVNEAERMTLLIMNSKSFVKWSYNAEEFEFCYEIDA